MNKINEIFNKVYVVSFEGSSRLPSLNKRLEGLDYEIIYGMGKKKINKDELRELGYNVDSKPYIDLGVFSCAYSHLITYRRIKEEKLNNVLILEDDVVMKIENFDNMEVCYRKLPSDWDLFFIGLNNVHGNYKNRLLRNYKNIMYKGDGFFPLEGTNAYAINNNYLNVVLNKMENPKTFCGPEQWNLFKYLNYYALIEQVFPAINKNNEPYDDGIIKDSEIWNW